MERGRRLALGRGVIQASSIVINILPPCRGVLRPSEATAARLALVLKKALEEILCGLVLEQWPRIVTVPVSDRVGTHIGERLDGERRVEAAHRRERRTPDHKQIGHVPALAVAVDN
jgi:hypothetical protein